MDPIFNSRCWVRGWGLCMLCYKSMTLFYMQCVCAWLMPVSAWQSSCVFTWPEFVLVGKASLHTFNLQEGHEAFSRTSHIAEIGVGWLGAQCCSICYHWLKTRCTWNLCPLSCYLRQWVCAISATPLAALQRSTQKFSALAYTLVKWNAVACLAWPSQMVCYKLPELLAMALPFQWGKYLGMHRSN